MHGPIHVRGNRDRRRRIGVAGAGNRAPRPARGDGRLRRPRGGVCQHYLRRDPRVHRPVKLQAEHIVGRRWHRAGDVGRDIEQYRVDAPSHVIGDVSQIGRVHRGEGLGQAVGRAGAGAVERKRCKQVNVRRVGHYRRRENDRRLRVGVSARPQQIGRCRRHRRCRDRHHVDDVGRNIIGRIRLIGGHREGENGVGADARATRAPIPEGIAIGRPRRQRGRGAGNIAPRSQYSPGASRVVGRGNRIYRQEIGRQRGAFRGREAVTGAAALHNAAECPTGKDKRACAIGRKGEEVHRRPIGVASAADGFSRLGGAGHRADEHGRIDPAEVCHQKTALPGGERVTLIGALHNAVKGPTDKGVGNSGIGDRCRHGDRRAVGEDSAASRCSRLRRVGRRADHDRQAVG